MTIELIKVPVEEREVLARLLELYEYDFSEYTQEDVNPLGLYGYMYLDYYWTEKRRFPYFIKVDGKLAGFVMICDYCYLSKDKDTLFVAEFFIMKKYRRNGIGLKAAKQVLNLHPGKWELTTHPDNQTSVKFWEKVVKSNAKTYEFHENVAEVYDNALAYAYTFTI